MLDRKRKKSVSKTMISLLLCTAITLNTGCQSTNKTAGTLRGEDTHPTSSQVKTQEVETPGTQEEKPPQGSNGLKDTLDGTGKFVGNAANFTGQVALVGAVVVGAMFVDYQMWRLADKMF